MRVLKGRCISVEPHLETRGLAERVAAIEHIVVDG
jgi:hypothetical protein